MATRGLDSVTRARQLARRYLRCGTRATAQLYAYLKARDIPVNAIRLIVAESTRQGMLDDHACATLWAVHLADQGYAWDAVQERLLTKGLEAAVVRQVIAPLRAEADDGRRARSFVRQRLGQRGAFDRQRVGRWLAQRGFDTELIDRVLGVVRGVTTDPLDDAER